MSKYKKKTHLHREYTPEELEDVRRCSICGEPMDEGYCLDGGLAYYCSDKCLHHDFTDEEWAEECKNNEDSYWTTWWEE